MSTLGDLIESINTSLHSYSGTQEQATYLTAAITASDTTLPVASSDQIMRGLAEIDDELIYVQTSDSGGLSAPPFGRGYRGSTAAAHDAETQVLFDPAFPRVEIRRAIDQCVQGLYPKLFAIRDTDLEYVPNEVGFELPTDCDRVLEVKFLAPSDPLNQWVRVYGWAFDGTSGESNGKAINIFDTLPPGSTVRVVYAGKFAAFASTDDTLESVGLLESTADLILFGVTSRMVRFMDPARLQATAVENLSRASVIQVGDAGKIANQLYAMYQQRLIEERAKLLDLYPPQIHFQR